MHGKFTLHACREVNLRSLLSLVTGILPPSGSKSVVTVTPNALWDT